MALEEKVLSLNLDLSNTALASLVGPMDANLRQIEVILDVSISRRNNQFRIAGEQEKAREALNALETLAHRAENSSEELTTDDVQLFFVGENAKKVDGDSPTSPVLHTKRRELQGRTFKAEPLAKMTTSKPFWIMTLPSESVLPVRVKRI